MMVEGNMSAEDNQAHVSQKPNSSVSTLYRCQSQDARKICVYDVANKLKHSETYDIGGTYTNPEKDLWFYYTTTVCPGYNYLLNLFVCHRKTGNFSIGVSGSNELIHKKNPSDICGKAFLPTSLAWHSYSSAKPDEHYYIKTFCFSEKDLKVLENSTLVMPVSINMNPPHALNMDVIKRIKLSHDFGALLSKQEKTDFVIESSCGAKFQTHKIILTAHSPVLRDMIKNTTSTSLFIDLENKDIRLLLQFLYTGTIEDILKKDCLKLLEIADKFQLKNLFALIQSSIGEQISVNNAVDIAVMSEKYGLVDLQLIVFKFMKNNPTVLKTSAWYNLSDVNLVKKFIQYEYMAKVDS